MTTFLFYWVRHEAPGVSLGVVYGLYFNLMNYAEIYVSLQVHCSGGGSFLLSVFGHL